MYENTVVIISVTLYLVRTWLGAHHLSGLLQRQGEGGKVRTGLG